MHASLRPSAGRDCYNAIAIWAVVARHPASLWRLPLFPYSGPALPARAQAPAGIQTNISSGSPPRGQARDSLRRNGGIGFAIPPYAFQAKQRWALLIREWRL